MASVVKERIATDLQKAKEEGGLRADRIREIVKAAVSQAVSELKEGSGEIGTVAKDAIAAVIDLVKERGQDVKADLTASVEGVVEGIKTSRQDSLAKTQAQVDHLQTQLDSQAEILDAEVDGALVAIEETTAEEPTSELKSLLEAAIHAIRESKQFAAAKEQYAKLRAQLDTLDAKLSERYGDRYEQVKLQLEKYWESARAWYEKTKTEVNVGAPDPVQRMQVELGAKMAEAGAAAARKEKEVKQTIKEVLHTETQQ